MHGVKKDDVALTDFLIARLTVKGGALVDCARSFVLPSWFHGHGRYAETDALFQSGWAKRFTDCELLAQNGSSHECGRSYQTRNMLPSVRVHIPPLLLKANAKQPFSLQAPESLHAKFHKVLDRPLVCPAAIGYCPLWHRVVEQGQHNPHAMRPNPFQDAPVVLQGLPVKLQNNVARYKLSIKGNFLLMMGPPQYFEKLC